MSYVDQATIWTLAILAGFTISMQIGIYLQVKGLKELRRVKESISRPQAKVLPGKVLQTPNGTYTIEEEPTKRKAIYADEISDDDS